MQSRGLTRAGYHPDRLLGPRSTTSPERLLEGIRVQTTGPATDPSLMYAQRNCHDEILSSCTERRSSTSPAKRNSARRAGAPRRPGDAPVSWSPSRMARNTACDSARSRGAPERVERVDRVERDLVPWPSHVILTDPRVHTRSFDLPPPPSVFHRTAIRHPE